MKYHTSDYVAQLMGKSKRHITDLCRQGKFPGAYQHGSRKSWLIPADAVAELLASQPLDITVLPAEVAELVPKETMQEYLIRVVDERVAEVEKRHSEEVREVREELAEARREYAEAITKNREEVQEMLAERDRKLDGFIAEWRAEKKKRPWWAFWRR